MSKNKIKDKKIKRIIKLINNGKLDKALEKANVNDVEDLLVVGVLFGQNKVYDVAEKIFDFVVHINPNDARAWYNKGVALVNLGKHDEAIKCFDKAIKINPNDAKAWYNKGVELVNLGKYDEAIKCYDKAIKIDPKDDKVWYNKGVELVNLGKYDEAIKCFDKAIKIDPKDSKKWSNKGAALANLGKHDEAIKCFDKAIKIYPKDYMAWSNKGAELVYFGKHDEAIKCFDKAIKIDPKDDKVWFNKGVELVNLGKYDEAIKCYDKAIKIDPNFEKAWFNKGVELVNLGKYDEAIKCFDKAIKIDPNDAGTWSNKGAALGNLGKYDEAIKCFDKAIKIDPTDDKAWYNKGTALGNFGKYDEAIKYFDKAIKIDPNDDKVWYNKGAVLRNLGKYDEEIKCYDKAIKINPKDAKAYYNKGVAFLSLRKYDNAKTELGMAKELFLDSGIKNEANKARKLKSLAKNASELIPKLKPLDEQFKSCLYSSSLKKLKDKSLKVSEEMKSVIKKFGKSKLPEDVILLLESKKICFTTLSNSLEFKKVNLNKLRDTEGVFEDWNLDTFATAVNFLIAFIYGLKKYKSFEEINRKVESQLLQVLKTSNVLDGELTEEIAGKFKGEPYVAKPISTKVEKNPKIIYKYIADTKREWVRFCLVQLDFSIEYQCPPKKFGHVLNEKDKIKNKVFKALKIARKNKVDLICFPELSFSKEWVKEMKNHYHDMIIIGGSYYDEGYNVCPIIIDGIYIRPPYKKHCPSPIENPKTTNRGMRSGDILYIFQTKCGRFSVLTCIDYVDQSYRICRYRDKIVDFIINPCYDRNIFRFQHRCNSDCEDYDINVIQVNKAQDKSGYGSSCIIGKEHKDILKKLRDDGLKPKDDIKYKLCQLDGEIMIIADLNIRMKAPPVNLPIDYTGRINISKEKCYKYESEHWVPLI